MAKRKVINPSGSFLTGEKIAFVADVHRYDSETLKPVHLFIGKWSFPANDKILEKIFNLRLVKKGTHSLIFNRRERTVEFQIIGLLPFKVEPKIVKITIEAIE